MPPDPLLVTVTDWDRAVDEWATRQDAILVDTYLQAWRQGADALEAELVALHLGEDISGRLRASVERLGAALAAARQGLSRMRTELLALVAGSGRPDGFPEWRRRSAHRLVQGESVAWAGEQSGYAEAAWFYGVPVRWRTQQDGGVCPDCVDLARYPARPLDLWPTTPGAGRTVCNVGCRCTFEAVHDVSSEVLMAAALATGLVTAGTVTGEVAPGP